VSPWIIAHRGAMAEAPENTAAAFNRALDYPIDGIEFDVQLSRDGIPVIFHDATLKKINQSKKLVSAYSYPELCRMDWGAWFSGRFKGEPVLTLDQVLLDYGAKTKLLVEIKSRGVNELDELSPSEAMLAELVPARMQELVPDPWRSLSLIVSFNPRVIARAAEYAPKLQYGWNLKAERLPPADRPGYLRALSLPLRKMTRRFVDCCHEEGLAAMTYSCNTARQARWALSIGVDVIMTDDPGKICPFISTRKGESQGE